MTNPITTTTEHLNGAAIKVKDILYKVLWGALGISGTLIAVIYFNLVSMIHDSRSGEENLRIMVQTQELRAFERYEHTLDLIYQQSVAIGALATTIQERGNNYEDRFATINERINGNTAAIVSVDSAVDRLRLDFINNVLQ